MKRPSLNHPPILYGAYALAGLSLVWSGYAITDLMHSGRFGLSVALAGDIGWVTVLWAEYRGVTIRIKDRTFGATPAGWAIALGVAALLVLHGRDEHSTAQAIAGPFVVLVGKVVWTFALAALRDPAALTAEQEAEIADVMRHSEYQARLHDARLEGVDRAADAEIARIRAEARITLARDDADAQIRLERIAKIREIERRTPLAIEPAEPPAELKARPPEPPTVSKTVVLASSLATQPEPDAQPVTAFGFSAHLSTQSAQRAEAIERVAELLAQDPGLTSGQVVEALAVSPATAKRYLREARRST